MLDGAALAFAHDRRADENDGEDRQVIALLSIPVFVVVFLLSGSFTPFESMPAFLQDAMYISPSTHFVRFAQAVLYRGAGIDVIWPDIAIMAALGGLFLAVALLRFRSMLMRQY